MAVPALDYREHHQFECEALGVDDPAIAARKRR